MRKTSVRSGALGTVSIVIVLLLATLPGQGARAQAAGVPPILAGTYAYPHDVSHANGVVLSALEPTISMLPYFLQPMVRSRIEARLAIPRRITVALDGDTVRVTYVSDREITVESPLDAESRVTSRDGASVPVVQRIHVGWLEQTFTGDTGTLTVLLSTEPDGATMHVDATARGERLPTAVPVRLDYVREH